MKEEEKLNETFDELWHIKKNLQFEFVETNFEKHDNTNFETTLSYKKINNHKGSNQKYKVDFYFFVPKSIVSKDFSSQDFLNSLTNYLRLRTIDLPPSIFLDIHDERSPLCQMLKIKNELLNNPQVDMTEQIVDATRNAASYILHQLKSLGLKDQFPVNYDVVNHYHTELDLSVHMLEAFRGILYQYNQIFPRRLSPTLENINLIDEYISYHVEKRWIRVLSCKRINQNRDLVHRIKELLIVEFRHRESFKFLVKKHPTELHNEREGELFTYHLGLVKKFVQDQLYLDVSYIKNNLYLANSAAMVGAAIAALFAYSIEFLNRGVYGWNWDYHAVAIISVSVFAYVLKDRIKELTKTLFQRKLSSYDLRRNVFLRHKPKTPFAHTIEKVQILMPDTLPEDIKSIRNQTAFAHIVQYRHEKVIHYSKTIDIDWKILNDGQQVLRDEIKEIYRFNLTDFCDQMDNPDKLFHFFDPNSLEIQHIQLPKVYHLNLIMFLAPYVDSKQLDNSKVVYLRTRLVLDKHGIKRVEDVPIE